MGFGFLLLRISCWGCISVAFFVVVAVVVVLFLELFREKKFERDRSFLVVKCTHCQHCVLEFATQFGTLLHRKVENLGRDFDSIGETFFVSCTASFCDEPCDSGLYILGDVEDDFGCFVVEIAPLASFGCTEDAIECC